MGSTASSEAVDTVIQEVSLRLRALLQTVENCFQQIDDAGVWHRATGNGNAIGNLCLHLAGNLRQLVVSGIGGTPYKRDRAAEFGARGGPGKEEVLGTLRAAIQEACAVIDKTSGDRLGDRIPALGAERTVAFVLVLAVTHTGLHVGQIQMMTRALAGEGYRETWASQPGPAPAK